MPDLNKVFLIGNLTQDPELRYTASQIAVTDLRLAINRSWTSKDGDRREDTLFIDVTVWNRQAENCCQFLRKGRAVHIEGYLKMDSWDDKTTGEKRTKVKVEAERVQFLGGNRDDGGGADDGPAAREPRRVAQESRGAASNGASKAYGAGGGGPSRQSTPAQPESAADDDIPF
jgi:single-strand DNA-binding protein